MTDSSNPTPAPSADTLFLSAVDRYRRGELQMALALAWQGLQTKGDDLRLLNIAGAAAMGMGRPDAAEFFWRRAIALQPGSCDAHNNLGILLQEAKRFPEAESSFRAALACRPDFAEAHYNLANLLKLLRRDQEAEAAYLAALGCRPDYADALNNFGMLLQMQKNFAEAEQQFRAALACRQAFPEAYNNLGNLLKELGRFPEAEAAYRQALSLRPNYPEACNNLGVLLRELKRPAEAEEVYRQALAIRPKYLEAQYNLANLLVELKRFAEAETLYLHALEMKPGAADILRSLGGVYKETGRFGQAEAAYRKALAQQPESAEAYNNLGALYQEMNRFEEAEAAYRQALACRPDYAEAYSNLGTLLQELKRFEEAESAYRTALNLSPDYADARFNLSLLLLSAGRWDEGWPHYEARYHRDKSRKATHVPALDFPQWTGEPLAGRSIVIWAEQGLGDEIQFARFAQMLRSSGVRWISWVCKAPLKRLFLNSGIADAILTQEEAAGIERHDFWTFPLSIPLHLKITPDTIPARLPYLWASQEEVIKLERVMQPQSALRVGILWKGSPLHPNDRNRSLPGLATLARLWSIPGIAFVSLQKGPGMEEAASPPASQPLLDLGSRIEDLADTAAIVSSLDLVICIDTALAHLAGAMGKPCWILLSEIGADWRWLNGREDTPWYPGAVRLFRQKSASDWSETVREVEESLRQWGAKRGHADGST